MSETQRAYFYRIAAGLIGVAAAIGVVGPEDAEVLSRQVDVVLNSVAALAAVVSTVLAVFNTSTKPAA